MRETILELSLDPLTWRGDPDDHKLISEQVVDIGGVLHHIEAYSADVETTTEGCTVQVLCEDGETIAGAVGSDGPWQTVRIDDHDYAIVITPFCE